MRLSCSGKALVSRAASRFLVSVLQHPPKPSGAQVEPLRNPGIAASSCASVMATPSLLTPGTIRPAIDDQGEWDAHQAIGCLGIPAETSSMGVPRRDVQGVFARRSSSAICSEVSSSPNLSRSCSNISRCSSREAALVALKLGLGRTHAVNLPRWPLAQAGFSQRTVAAGTLLRKVQVLPTGAIAGSLLA